MRKSISKKTRFEVFKRDSFRCQYCGRSVPDVILEVDHLDPVANNGANNILNYVTSCVDCNRGKGPRKLDDETVAARSRAGTAALLERREQLDMLLRSRSGLVDALASETARLEQYFSDRTNLNCEKPWKMGDAARNELKGLIRKFGAPKVVSAIDGAVDAYLVVADGKATSESWERIFGALRAFCDDGLRNLYYIRGILRKRVHWLDEREAMDILKEAAKGGVSADDLRAAALNCSSWSGWRYEVEELRANVDGRA